MDRDEKDRLDEEEPEIDWGESLEQVVVEIKNLLPFLESAFSGVEYAAAALRAEELGFDRHTVFWPIVFPKETTYGMAWSNDPELVAAIEPPPDPSPGWKLDPYYGDRVRYWNGEEWDLVSAPAPGNLDLYERIAAGEDLGEVPEAVTIHPANAREPDPLLETLKKSSKTPRDVEESGNRSEQNTRSEPDEDEVTASDLRQAREIARFIAERAFGFDDHEARAWALTDFEVWSMIAGESAQLSFEPTASEKVRP